MNDLKEVLRGEGYGENLELVGGLIIPRVEELPIARAQIANGYATYTEHHSVNPILYEVFTEGDPTSLLDDARRETHKEFLFDLLHKREVRGINPLPRTHAHYSFVQKEGYLGYDELTELITKYFGVLLITESSCKEIAQQFHTYCLSKDNEQTEDEGAPDPYYAEIYRIYMMLMNDGYEIGGADKVLLKRYVSFLCCERERLPTFLKTYLYHDYPWEEEPLFVRGQRYYQVAVGELINLLHHLEKIEGVGVCYEQHEHKLLKELGYPFRSASDAMVFLAIREHALLECYDKVMGKVSKGRTKNIDLCLQLVRILRDHQELFAPFIPALEKCMRDRHHALWQIYATYGRGDIYE